MKTFKNIQDTARYIKKNRREGNSIGLVPTMGYLHQGHLSLVKKARQENKIVIMSIFVNPTQFGPNEDYKKYPRDIRRDERMAKEAGVDAVFYPTVKAMYPNGYKTYVQVEDITERLCGSSRPDHFKGVATVVTKLFNIVQPDSAYFGQKDAQQAVVIKRMARDLDMNLKIKVLPIVREPDGLAMSSRNVYLSEGQRRDALVLYESLNLAKRLIKDGIRDADEVRLRMKRLISSKDSARIDYISISDIGSLNEVKVIGKDTLIALGVWIGKTRLIDNIVIGGRI
jgi:pantoate--beta-alanine ligase